MRKTSLVLLACSVVACSGGGAGLVTVEGAAETSHECGVAPPPAPSPSLAPATGCDPLAGEARPIALGVVEVAGRAPDGTIYVVDAVPKHMKRVFISDGDVIRRRRTQSVGGAETITTVTFDETDTITWSRSLRCQDQEPTLSVKRGGLGEKLTVIPASEIARFPLENLAGGTVLYTSTGADETRLFLISPHADATSSEWRIFQGPADRVQERKLLGMTTNEYGGLTSVSFDRDGFATVQPVQMTMASSAELRAKSSRELFAGLHVVCL